MGAIKGLVVNQHPHQITPFLAALEALQHLISRFDQRGIIIGGVAARILGKPRLTADLDAMILLSIDDIP